jgi:CheY-like chemotaxis protein
VNKNGPLVFVDDDEDDRLLVRSVLDELHFPNEILFFSNGLEALEYIENCVQIPFVIVSDINMPKMTGVDLFRAILKLERTDLKATPLIFMSTNPTNQVAPRLQIREVQGMFRKPAEYNENLKMWKTIVNYWKACDTNWDGKIDHGKLN